MDLEGVGVDLGVGALETKVMIVQQLNLASVVASAEAVLVEIKVALENRKKMETVEVGVDLDQEAGVVLAEEDLERSQMVRVAAEVVDLGLEVDLALEEDLGRRMATLEVVVDLVEVKNASITVFT